MKLASINAPSTAVSPPAALASVDPSLVAAIRATIDPSDRSARRQGCRLYVAPDLSSFEASPDDAEIFGRDLTQTDSDGIRRVYRRLSAPYYVWLKERLAEFKARLPLDVLDPMHYRYAVLVARCAPIRAAALAHFDATHLAQLTALGARGRYVGPRPEGHGQVLIALGTSMPPISHECRAYCNAITGAGRRRHGTKAKKQP